jgi:hypothetical protein
MFRKLMSAAAVAAMLAAPAAHAALTTYMTVDSFSGALIAGSLQTESFEGYAAGDSGVLPVFSTAGTLTGADQVKDGINNGRHATTGDMYWEGGSEPFEVTFASAIQAFGFFGIDIGDFTSDCGSDTCLAPGGALKLEFFTKAGDAAPAQTEIVNGEDSDGSANFYGFVDATGASYEMIRFTNLQSIWDGQGFDDLMIGRVEVIDEPPVGNVPEPGMLAMVGLGLLSLSALRRRRL